MLIVMFEILHNSSSQFLQGVEIPCKNFLSRPDGQLACNLLDDFVPVDDNRACCKQVCTGTVCVEQLGQRHHISSVKLAFAVCCHVAIRCVFGRQG